MEFTETSRTLEAKVGDTFYKVIVDPNGAQVVRTKNPNARTGFGTYGCVPMVETFTDEGKWASLLKNHPARLLNLEAAQRVIAEAARG
jgi:hypothetical protein